MLNSGLLIKELFPERFLIKRVFLLKIFSQILLIPKILLAPPVNTTDLIAILAFILSKTLSLTISSISSYLGLIIP